MSSPPNKAKESELSNSHESETAAKIYYKKPTNDLKRVIGIDFSRGWGMFIVIVTHLFNFWGLGFLSLAEESPSSARPLLQTILSFPFLWQATWTSAFAFFSGAGILFTLHYHIHDKKMDVKKRLKKSSMNFVVLFIVNFIYVYLSIYPIYDINYIRQRGLIPGSLSAGTFTPPDITIFFIASPLTMILFSDIFLTLVCAIMWRNGVDRSKHRQYSIILFVIGCLFIFLAEPIRGLLIPVLNECYQNRNYFFAMILGWFVGSKDCVFPYVGFAFIASIYSLYLREETPNFEGMKKYGYGSALFFLTIGLVYSAFNGFPSMDDWFAPYLPFFMVMLNLFGQGFWLTYFILLFDRDPLEKRASKWKYRQSVRFLRLSMISLTVFLLEQTTAALYSIISKAIIPQSWFSNMYFLGIWTAVYTFSWFQLIYVWDKKKSFKYSIEWCITKLRTVKKKLPKDPLMLDYIIYIPSGFASRDFYHQQNNNKESEIQRKSCKN